ncbi:hypothetical protein DO97_11960 [Neosynechococcus sphagnicola sy1]|uniref:DUF3040 domain-containing protein n=1 Tax=Neosynechococcus sphagnicola sy1 TaxID=1497020 RepID=A0A098TJX0_9CYAN|nr:hypothetical protein [Neosynechococcus sphagnicola]KGF72142.1 hypothetical protein DO97_11960 [Neosynechococcus sphagnicola sy1]
MSAPNPQEDELHRREQELAARERALRLRELEQEINHRSPPPRSLNPGAFSPRALSRTLVKWATFFAIVVAVVVAIRVAAWLTHIVLVLVVAWVVYKLFFQGDRPHGSP